MEVESVVRAVFEEAWNDQRFENIEGAFAESFSLHLGGVSRLTTVEHMFFFRVENQRIVEVWELLDQDEFRRQLTGS
jgi:hypothetical protein